MKKNVIPTSDYESSVAIVEGL